MSKAETIVKEIKPDNSVWDSRASSIRSEVENLTRRRDALVKEMESMQTAITQQAEQRLNDTRKAAAKVAEDRQRLESEKADFLVALTELRSKQNVFEAEKTKILDMKANYEKAEAKVGEFVRMVKSGAERL